MPAACGIRQAEDSLSISPDVATDNFDGARRARSEDNAMHDNVIHVRSQVPGAAAPGITALSAAPPHEISGVWIIVAVVCIGSFMGQLDASITQLALPALESDFSASVADVSWVAVIFLLAVTVMLPVFGRLADMFGRKKQYAAGFLVFIAGSALCGFAPGIGALIAARALQAVGAAMISANSVAIIVSVAGDRLRGKALGIQAAVQAIGLCAGPTVGGWIVDTLDWRWVFWVNVPFGLLGTILAWFIIPETSAAKPGSRFDALGALLLVPALGALMLAINQVGSWGLTSPGVIGSAAAGVLLLVGLIIWERRASDPLIRLSMFGKWSFACGNLVGLFAFVILFGLFFLMPFAFERVFGESSFAAGLRLTTIPIALGICAPISGALSDRIGNRLLCACGMLIVCIGLLSLYIQFETATPSLLLVTLSLVVVGIGEGTFFAPNNNAIMGSASVAESGAAGSLLNVTRDLGTSVGIAMAASLLSWQLRLLTGGSSTLSASEADLTSAIRTIVMILALLAGFAAMLSWVRPSAVARHTSDRT
jgi:EmrB/QacA subfamily drug resistance transporter